MLSFGDIMFLVVSYSISLFSTFIVFDFMSKFERKIYRKKYFYIISYIAYTGILLISYSIFRNDFLNIFITLIGAILIGHFLYNDNKIYILYYGIFIIFVLVFQVVIGWIFNLFFSNKIINFYSLDIAILANGIINQLATLSASRLFTSYFKNKNIENLNKIQFFNFLILPIFSIMYIMTLLMYTNLFVSLKDTLFIMVNIISIVFLNIFITNIFQSISRNNEMKNKLSLYEQQATINYNYYNSLEEKYKNSRKIIHDIKNHINTIERLYKEDWNNNAKIYKEDLNEMFRSLEQRYYTENKVLNIIINDKVEKGKKFGIEIDCKIGDINLEKIRDIDLTTIFSNLLDNSIDEVKEFEKDKIIYLKVERFNDFTVINVTNELKSKPVKDKEGFKTIKKNHTGLGIQNVKMAIEKYDGTLRINFTENHFKVNIVI